MPAASLRRLFVALTLVALGLPIAFVSLFRVVTDINNLNARIATVREAQLAAGDIVRLAAEQETSVRGFAATHDPAFVLTYRSAAREQSERIADVSARLVAGGDDAAAATALADGTAAAANWRLGVAEPVLARQLPRIDDGRARVDLARFRADLRRVSAILVADYRRLIEARSQAARRVSFIGYAALVVVALQVLVYAFLADRLRGQLARERRVVAVLQDAFTSEIVTSPKLDVSAAYVSATRGAKVGGDVYDVFPLDADRTLIAIADVSGKGVEAAVDSTFVKYSLRALATQSADIADVVTTFNALYARAQKAPEAFVVIFAGILDSGTATLRYVNAGHEAAYVRRPEGIEALLPTGPLIGIAPDVAFGAASTQLNADDLLFLSTDGLTEARNPAGRFLGGDDLQSWLAETGTVGPREVVDAIGRRLRRYTRAQSSDDLAILAVRPRPVR